MSRSIQFFCELAVFVVLMALCVIMISNASALEALLHG
jgi:hypothetical protein